MGGKIKLPEVQMPELVLNQISIDSNENVQIQANQTDLSLSSVKSSKINTPDVNITVPKIKTPKVDFESPSIDLDIKSPPLNGFDLNKTNTFSINADVDFSSNFKPQDLFYGVDLPITIVNNDFQWSGAKSKISDDRILQRSFIDSSKIDSRFQNFYYPFGNHNIIDQSHLSSSPIEFEFKKAKIRKDPLISVNKFSGDVNFQGEASVRTRDSSEVNSKTKSTNFFRKLSSASSVSNIATKKSTLKSELVSRSESADPTTRKKIDYTIPRKCSISTRPDFDGLGIHIACDKKTRLSPYIHEVEIGSPGIKAGLRKNDYILEVNGEDAVFMEFTQLITKIQNHIKENNLCLTVGNEKAHKKWVKNSQNAAKKMCCKEVKAKK